MRAAPLARLVARHAHLEALPGACEAVHADPRAALAAQDSVVFAASVLTLVPTEQDLLALFRTALMRMRLTALSLALVLARVVCVLALVLAWLQHMADLDHSVAARPMGLLLVPANDVVGPGPRLSTRHPLPVATMQRHFDLRAALDVLELLRSLDLPTLFGLVVFAWQRHLDRLFTTCRARVVGLRREAIHATPTAFVTAPLRALPGASRCALDIFVLLVERMAAERAAVAAVGQQGLALLGATSMQRVAVEFFGAGYQTALGRVLGATKVQLRTNLLARFQRGQDLEPLVILAKLTCVAQNVHAMSGSRECHDDPVLDGDEPELALGIAADKGQDHYVVLLALVVVNADNAHAGNHPQRRILPFAFSLAFAEEGLRENVVEVATRPRDVAGAKLFRHQLPHCALLPDVRCEQSDAALVDPVVHKMLREAHGELRFVLIDLRCALHAGALLILRVVDPIHRVRDSRYRRVRLNTGMVLNSVVEVPDEIADPRLHPKLRRQLCEIVVTDPHKPLEQRNVEVVVPAQVECAQLWSQLLVVTDHDDLLKVRRRQARHQLTLQQLPGLFDDHHVRRQTHEQVAVQGGESRRHAD
mmetsp:Transcript_100548/g.288920  ORF Transcript_100548/g.288920 Transcript_100548/m.288920 type:complete len:591 (+) Transcript_100548:549-2321(+)